MSYYTLRKYYQVLLYKMKYLKEERFDRLFGFEQTLKLLDRFVRNLVGVISCSSPGAG